jgi:hypothetical protein
MNSLYNEILQTSTSTWRFQRLELVLEFSRKSIVPFNCTIFIIWMIKAAIFFLGTLSMFRSKCDRIHNFLNYSDINSDLERLLKAFQVRPEEESQEKSSDYDDVYRNDAKMAALFRDIHGERFFISSYDSVHEAELQTQTRKADFIRDCADLAMAMCAKMVDSQKKERVWAAENGAEAAKIQTSVPVSTRDITS